MATSFGHMATRMPEAPQRPTESQSRLDIALCHGPGECRPQIVVLRLQAGEPYPLLRASKLRLRGLRQVEEVGGVPIVGAVQLATLDETLQRKLTDRLEHLQARRTL